MSSSLDPAVLSLRAPLRSWLWPCLAFVVGAGIAGPILYAYLSADIDREASRAWLSHGALRAFATGTVLAGAIPFVIVRRLVRGPRLPTGGWTLVHAPIVPVASGHRDARHPTIDDLASRLSKLGYRISVKACNASGRIRGSADRAGPLAGSHVLIRDRRWAGDIRLVLAPSGGTDQRRLGRLEVRAEPSSPTDELGLFVLRELDALVPSLRASRVDSALGADPASAFTVALRAKPRFAAADQPDGSLA
jgi:hypothetical protein